MEEKTKRDIKRFFAFAWRLFLAAGFIVSAVYLVETYMPKRDPTQPETLVSCADPGRNYWANSVKVEGDTIILVTQTGKNVEIQMLGKSACTITKEFPR